MNWLLLILEDRLGEQEPSEDFITKQPYAAHLVCFKHLCVLGREQQGMGRECFI